MRKIREMEEEEGEMEEEEDGTKHVNGKKTIFSLVSLDALPFSIIWCVLGSLSCFRCIWECCGVF